VLPHACRQEVVIDRQQCYDNGCDNSGCDGGAGYEEVESRWCSNLPQLCPLCKQETCCLRRPQLLCCQLLDCIEDRAGGAIAGIAIGSSGGLALLVLAVAAPKAHNTLGQHEVELGSSSQPLGKPHKPLFPDSKPGSLPYSSSSEYMYGPGQATVGAFLGNSGMWPGAQGQHSGDPAHVQAGALYRQEGSGSAYQGSSRGLQGHQGAGVVLDPDAILTHQVPFRPATPTQSATPLEPGAMAGRAGEEGAAV
ncbi:hypothetical protein HaLaN_25079, partial [Haematococcus lacustris]